MSLLSAQRDKVRRSRLFSVTSATSWAGPGASGESVGPTLRACSGRVTGSGSPTGIASSPRRTASWLSASSQGWAESGSVAGFPRNVARIIQREPLMPTMREACWPVRPSWVFTESWQTSSGPKRPSCSVAVPPRRAMSAASWGRMSLHRSPLRGAEKARSSRAPSAAAITTDCTFWLASSTWIRSSLPGTGAISIEPRSTRCTPSSPSSSAS